MLRGCAVNVTFLILYVNTISQEITLNDASFYLSEIIEYFDNMIYIPSRSHKYFSLWYLDTWPDL